MKHIYSILILALISLCYSNQASAQAPSCFDSYLSPFCSGIAQYPANFDPATGGLSAPAGPNYGCLGSQPNPTYFSLTIEQTGAINFTLDNTNGVDIDFILWGPFPSISAAQLACDSMGNGGQWGDIDSCSFDAQAQEPVSISNAQAGEVYILMVTNYSNLPTDIFSTLNTGSGGIACPCDIPSTVDTLTAASGNQGYLTDTTNGLNQFVVCPGNTLGFQIGARANLNDTLDIYGPFTTVNSAFANNSVFGLNPNAPANYDSLTIYTLITASNEDIGVNNFNMGLKNSIYTGGLTDSTCFDLLTMQVIVPGVVTSNRDICSGESFQVSIDSIPVTTLGSSSYSWSQLSGVSVSFSSISVREPIITIPVLNSTSSSDSIVLEVDYSYGGLCPMKDTMVLYFKDANIVVSATPDTLCVGQTSDLLVVLSDTLTPSVCDDYNVTTIPFASIAGSGTTVTLIDDDLSASLPIGFNFNFYCNNYTNFNICSNGFITFDPLSPTAWTPQMLPEASTPNDLIAMCWTDCNPTLGGTINYFTTGVTPNRQLVVNFINVSPFGPNSGNQTVQAILFEGSNIIELHVTNATPTSFGSLTLGLENAAGTIAHPAPNANFTSNTISNIAFRFEPKNFGPFYNWSPTASLTANDVPNPVATPPSTTTYSVTVTDGACSYIDTTTVHAIPSSVLITVDSSSNPSCDGISDGYVAVTTTGGNPAYSYNWSNSSTNEDATGLASGVYSLTVTDTDGCTNSTSVTLTTNPPIVIDITNNNNNSCDSIADGSIFINTLGGAGGYTFLWNTGVTTEDITNIPNNDYILTVTDANGCTDTAQVTVTPNFLLVITDSIIAPLCNGDNGTAIILVTGGTGSYSFDWGAASATTTNTAAVLPSSFAVTVTETTNGCTGIIPNVTMPSTPALTLSLVDTTNIGCTDLPNTGAVDVSAGGGTGSLNFLWDNSATTEDLTGVGAGNYTIIVTDANNCTISLTATVEETTNLTVNITTLTGNIGCDSLAIGSLEAVATGGTNISYTWSNGSTDANATGLASGNHMVTATNEDGCSDTSSTFITMSTVPSMNPYVSVTGTTSVMVPLNTSVTIDANGTGFTSYLWTSYVDPVTGNANITNPNQASTTANPSPSGTYGYIITGMTSDSTCTVTDTVWVTVEPNFLGIPTAFSPNGDDKNETFRPVTLTDDEVTTFLIYNRWGQIVFDGSDVHGEGWDGTYLGVPQAVDVYMYFLVYQKSGASEPTNVRGRFTLIR